jgi:hypothetical protein
VFGTLQEALNGRRFCSDDKVKETVHFCLQHQAKTFFFLLEYRSLLKMWKVHCKGWWLCGKITSHLDLYIWCASQYDAICPYLLKSLYTVCVLFILMVILQKLSASSYYSKNHQFLTLFSSEMPFFFKIGAHYPIS